MNIFVTMRSDGEKSVIRGGNSVKSGHGPLKGGPGATPKALGICPTVKLQTRLGFPDLLALQDGLGNLGECRNYRPTPPSYSNRVVSPRFGQTLVVNGPCIWMHGSMHTGEAGEDILNAACRLAISFYLHPSCLVTTTISILF